MANLTPSYVQVHPNYTLPEIILPYAQASGYMETLAGKNPLARLGEGDLYVYAKTLDVRTKVAAGQAAYNQLPSVSLNAAMIGTPTYLIRVRAEYDHHDVAAGGQWGISVPEAQRLGMRQGTFQQMRVAGLNGFAPANGEGLLNAAGATAVLLPADSNGQTTVTNYDNGQMAVFILTQIAALKTRTMQLGQPTRLVILGPQRVLGTFEYQNIVQLTQFQRTGGGSATTAGTVKAILDMNGDDIEWVYDDTLIGQGQGGSDAVLLVMPEVKKPVGGTEVNTNVFATLAPGLSACTLQLCDMVAPREIPTPLPGGAIDVLSELRITSGWALRGEGVVILSMPYP